MARVFNKKLKTKKGIITMKITLSINKDGLNDSQIDLVREFLEDINNEDFINILNGTEISMKQQIENGLEISIKRTYK
tara:strand:- start:30 stop:263 length:234 start_codon:yes stop_codon:yes gene_type:complete